MNRKMRDIHDSGDSQSRRKTCQSGEFDAGRSSMQSSSGPAEEKDSLSSFLNSSRLEPTILERRLLHAMGSLGLSRARALGGNQDAQSSRWAAQLQRFARPEPPAALVHRIMSHLDKNSRLSFLSRRRRASCRCSRPPSDSHALAPGRQEVAMDTTGLVVVVRRYPPR